MTFCGAGFRPLRKVPCRLYEDETPPQLDRPVTPACATAPRSRSSFAPLLVGQEGREVSAIAPQHLIGPLT